MSKMGGLGFTACLSLVLDNEWMNEWMFICTVTKSRKSFDILALYKSDYYYYIIIIIIIIIIMNLHNKTYMQDNKATLAALTGAL